jgi:hypothetical protein
MGKKLKDVFWLIILSGACGVIIWHVWHWQSLGKYDEMYEWLKTGKAYLSVSYNLGLMLVFGILLGLLMSRITELMTNLNNRDMQHKK